MPSILRAGAARVDITPPPGIDLSGYGARQNPATGVRDPLYTRALVLEDDRRQIAVVSCDILGFDRELADDARARIERATGIPGLQVLLAATHTHGGPATVFLQDCGERDPVWLATFEAQIAVAVAQAQAALVPATLAVGMGESTAGVHNRRRPGDGIDPAVGVLRVDGPDAAPLAVVVNYTCHPTCLHHENRRVTADYPGLVCATVEAATGAICLFLTGAIGDVGPSGRGEESLATVGQAVAAEVLRVLPGLAPLPSPWLDTEGDTLALPLAALPSRDELLEQRAAYLAQSLEAEAAGQDLAARVARANLHWTERILDQIKAGALHATVPAEVQTLHLGELVLAGVPGEFFVELGLQIKAACAPRPVFVVGFANDNIGYIPARRAYPFGGYEIEHAYRYYGYPAVLAPEAGEQIVARITSLIQNQRRIP
jgi:hypothetical protein